MIECFLSWMMLLVALFAEEGAAGWFIASGVYAIAAQIYLMREKGE